MENLGKISHYINTCIGIEMSDIQENTSIKGLPLFIKKSYIFHKIQIETNQYYLIEPKKEIEIKCSVLKIVSDAVKENTNIETIFLLAEINSELRRQMIINKLNFVVPDRQIYLPFAGIMLQERGLVINKKKTAKLSPVAQLIVIANIEKEPLSNLPISTIAQRLNYPVKTINLAINELEKNNLCETQESGRCRIVLFIENKELWKLASPLMTSPISKVLYCDNINDLESIKWTKTFDTALPFYTDIVETNSMSIAVYIRDPEWKQLKMQKNFHTMEGRIRIEEWKYPPDLLSNNDYVDPLSLAFCFDDNDERVDYQLNRLIQKTLCEE